MIFAFYVFETIQCCEGYFEGSNKGQDGGLIGHSARYKIGVTYHL